MDHFGPVHFPAVPRPPPEKRDFGALVPVFGTGEHPNAPSSRLFGTGEHPNAPIIALVAWKHWFDSTLRKLSVLPLYGLNGMVSRVFSLIALVALGAFFHSTPQAAPKLRKKKT